MGVSFAGLPGFSGMNRPTRFDAHVTDCEVEGEIPSDLHGTFYRMQCDFAYPSNDKDWLFNADGLVSQFRFVNGRCEYRGRYILTDRLMAERAARKRLFGVYRNHFTDDPSVANVDHSAANTHMYLHAGKFLTLKEDSLPVVVDPHTLDFVQSKYDFGGQYASQTMSAHPKIDPVTGDFIAYGYQAKGYLTKDVAVYTFDKSGKKKHEVWFEAPFLGIMHDCVLTQKHIAIPLVAMVTDEAWLKAGNRMWRWDGSYPTMIAVIPRDGSSKDVRWFKGPARSTLHFLNAITEGDKILLDLPTSDGPTDPSQYRRWIMDLNSKDDAFKEEVLFPASNGLLSRMDERVLSLPYRYAWSTNTDPTKPWDAERARGPRGGSNTVQRLDIKDKTTATYFVGDTHAMQEPMFVPRKRGGQEGDGYILVVAQNFAEWRSELKIIDAMKLEQGAVATVLMPFRLRSGTHSQWLSAEDLPFDA
jgi:carotenoid cleavage dioxygenase